MNRSRPVDRALLAALTAIAATACDPGGGGPVDIDSGTRPAADMNPADAGRQTWTGSLVVEYRSSLRPGPWITSLNGIAENDLFKFAVNTAWLTIRPPTDDRVVHLTVSRGEAVEYDAAVEGEAGENAAVTVTLDTASWPEGVHTMRYVALTEAGEEIVGEGQVRVYFNVTSIAADADDPHLLWLGTAEVGLLAYHLGEDPLDPADDTALPYGGREIEDVDIIPPRGRPWQGGGGYANQREPAGLALFDAVHAQGGVFVGAGWRGVSYLDDNGTPWDREDDRYALFHPGMNLEPETFEAGLANCVTAIVPDGEHGLWFGTLQGLFHVDHRGTLFNAGDDVWTAFDATDRYDPNIMRLTVDAGGRVWIASFDTDGANAGNTVTLLDPGGTPSDTGDDTWVRLALPEGFPAESSALATDGDVVYIGTSNGLYLLDHGGTPLDPADDTWRRLGLDDGLADDDVAALALRPDGQLWVGTFDICAGNGGGLMLLDPGACLGEGDCAPRVTYTVDDGLLDDDVSSLHLLPDGAVALGTFNLFAAPVLASFFVPEAAAECDDGGPEQTLGGGPMVGVDGLSIIHPGDDLGDKRDDGLVNL